MESGLGTTSQCCWKGRSLTLRAPGCPPRSSQVTVSWFALAASGVGQAAERLLGWPAAASTQVVAFGASFVAFAMLAQVDLLSGTTAPADKAVAVLWGTGGFAASLALHVLQPGCACCPWGAVCACGQLKLPACRVHDAAEMQATRSAPPLTL